MKLRCSIIKTLMFIIITVCIPSMSFATFAVGDTADNFTLSDLEGNQVSLYDLSEHVVLLNFFTTN